MKYGLDARLPPWFPFTSPFSGFWGPRQPLPTEMATTIPANIVRWCRHQVHSHMINCSQAAVLTWTSWRFREHLLHYWIPELRAWWIISEVDCAFDKNGITIHARVISNIKCYWCYMNMLIYFIKLFGHVPMNFSMRMWKSNVLGTRDA